MRILAECTGAVWFLVVGLAAGVYSASDEKVLAKVFEAAGTVLKAAEEASYAALTADSGFVKACADAGLPYLGGPMLGGVTGEGVLVWMRTCRPANVEVVVSADGRERRFGPVASTVENDLVAVVHVTGLKPGTAYPYRVLIDGAAVPIPEHARIITAPAEDRPVRIAFSSCPHTGGLNNRALLDAVRARRPAAFLCNGDVVGHDKGGHRGLQRLQYLRRDFFPAWRDFACTVPFYATWDDHDYYGDNVYGLLKCTPEVRDRNLAVFKASWNNPSCGFPVAGFENGHGGVFFRTRIGAADVIMTDNRYFRSADNYDDGRQSFLGKAQTAWLKAQLADCKGPFIILSCGTMWRDRGKDSWSKHKDYLRERNELFQFIEDRNIKGVLLISGDAHGASGVKIPRPSGYHFYEFEVANLGASGNHTHWAEKHPDLILYCTGNEIAGNHVGEFTIDPTPPDPTVTFNFLRPDGKSDYELVLKRSQLTPRPPTPAQGRDGSSSGS
jgi:alkaline phosphatase D